MAEGVLEIVKRHRCGERWQWSAVLFLAGAAALIFGLSGCGETAHVTPASSTGEVHNYLNGKMGNSSSYYDNLEITVDHSANEILASSMMQGTITATGAGLLDISETYAISGTTTGSTLTLQSPAPQGFLAEIPGVGAFGETISPINSPKNTPVSMAAVDECPNFPTAVRFLYVATPHGTGIADSYGTVRHQHPGSDRHHECEWLCGTINTRGVAPSTPTNLVGARDARRRRKAT